MASEREIFDHALTILDVRQRAEYLQQACGEDKALREHIEGLLEAHAKLGGFLEKPPLDDPDPAVERPITEGPGAIIGPYKLLQKLGEGGFGVVYMAEQAEPVERRVALKIIKPGMDSRQVISRFKAEEQALAIMDHPNIARVFDAGITESARPYFVMELVKGVPITKYCDEQHLTPRQRLELFIPVCHAVQHAHQKGIIHRDLKPSNVLVALYDDKPVPKVIDFGVAKATSQKLTEQTKFTQYGQLVGTLEYMSPEQANLNQSDIDTRSDIYSLGVLLYELLTGETPFDRRRLYSAAFDEMLRIIREEEPPRPSLRLSTSETLPSIAANRHIEPKKLNTLVRGELDWIVMKALEKDRSRRYETANALADDIERYLNDEPVVACPPSAAYRFRKFVRRNKAPLAVVLMVVLGLIAVAVGAGLAAARFLDLARRNADLAAEKQTALTSAIAAQKAATKARDQEAAQRKEAQRQTQIAEGALADVEQQQQRAEGNLDLALAALDAVYLEAIGRDKLLGEPVSQPAKLKPPESEEPPPLSDLERELLRRGLRFYDQFAQKNAAAPHAFVQTAQAYYRVGLLQWALEDGAAAAEAYRGAVERFERLTKEEPQSAEYFRQLAEAYGGLAMVVPQWDAAKALFEKSRSAYSRAIELKPDDGLLYLRRAGISGHLGDVGKAAEDCEKARQLDPDRIDALLECSHFHRIGGGNPKRGREYAERAVSLAPDNPKCHLALAESLAFEKCRWIGPGKMRLSDPAPALEHYARAIELAPASPVGYRARGKFYRWIEDNDRALADVNRALELQPRDRWALKNRGIILARLGQFDKALADLAAHNRFYPHDLAAHRQIVEIHMATGNWQSAVESMTRILELDPSPWQVLIRRAWAHINLGQHEQALADLKRALELNSDRAGTLGMSETVRLAAASDEFRQRVLEFARDAVDKSPDRAQALQDRADFYLGLSEWEKAQADLEKLVASETASHVPHYQHALVCLILNEARKYRDACAAMARKFGKSDDPMAANFVAWTCALAPDAVDDYGPVLALATNAVEACPDSDQCLNTLGAILYRAGRHEEAIKWLAELDRPIEGPDARADSSPAYAWYYLAMLHKKVGTEEKAREYLEKANQATRESLADEENPPVWNRRATLELLRKEAEALVTAPDDGPEPAAQKSAEPTGDAGLSLTGPCQWVLLCRRARRLVAEENWSEAAGAFSEAIDLRPDRCDLWKGRGEAHEKLDQWDAAMADYQKAIQLEPEKWGSWKTRAERLAQSGHSDKAIALFTSLLERHPDSAEIWQARGAAHHELKQWDQAISDYGQLIKLKPDDVKTYVQRAIAYRCSGHLNEALEDANTGLLAKPDHAGLLHERAVIYETMKQWDKAFADYDKAIGLAPQNHSLYRDRGRAHSQLNQWDKALADYEQAIKLNPDDSVVSLIRAQILLMADRSDEYRQTCLQILDRFGQSEDWEVFCHAARACVLAPQGVPDPAVPVDLARRAVSSNPREWTLYTLGMAHLRAGDLDEAERRFQESLKTVPSWRARFLNWFGLALVHHQRGETEEARHWRGEAVKLMEQHPGPAPQNRIEGQLLRREVEQLLGGTEQEAESKKEE